MRLGMRRLEIIEIHTLLAGGAILTIGAAAQNGADAIPREPGQARDLANADALSV